MKMGCTHSADQLLLGKILRISPGAEIGTAYIHRVCPCSQGCLKGFIGTCRRQKLCFIHICHNPSLLFSAVQNLFSESLKTDKGDYRSNPPLTFTLVMTQFRLPAL